MPQPINPNSWQFPPKGTLARPGISSAITAVLAEWTWVESGLVALVGNVCGASRDPASGSVEFYTNMIAYNMMATAETIRGRIKLLDASVGKLLEASSLEERWKIFISNLTKRSRERNRIAHAQWMQSDQYPDDLIEYDPRKREMFRWTERDILDCVERIVAIRNEAHLMQMDIVSAFHRGELDESAFGPKRI